MFSQKRLWSALSITWSWPFFTYWKPLHSHLTNQSIHLLVVVLAPVLTDRIGIRTRFLLGPKKVLGSEQAYAPVVNQDILTSDLVDMPDRDPHGQEIERCRQSRFQDNLCWGRTHLWVLLYNDLAEETVATTSDSLWILKPCSGLRKKRRHLCGLPYSNHADFILNQVNSLVSGRDNSFCSITIHFVPLSLSSCFLHHFLGIDVFTQPQRLR